MPTPGLQPADPAVRQVARSFGADAARYDRTRPGYPDELVHAVVAALPGPVVLDVGCGTGISSRQFQAAGCRVHGVDPDERMAALAPVPVEVAAFESWEPAGRRYDGVVSGQAWHWVDPVVGAQKAREVLAPGGRLAVFWNAFDPPAEVAALLGAAFAAALGRGPARALPGLHSYEAMFERAREGMAAAGMEPQEWRFEWQRDWRRQEWLDQVPTFGGFAQMAPDAQELLLEGMGEAVDQLGGAFTMRYNSVVVTAARP